MSDKSEVSSPIDLRAIALGLVAIVLLTPTVMSFATGFGLQPALSVDEPINSVPEGETIVGYESLSSPSQDAFREASGSRFVILDEPFPTADYVKLDGQYYPITMSEELPAPLTVLFTVSGMVGALLSLVFLGSLYTNSARLQQATTYFKRGCSYVDPGPEVSGVLVALFVASGFWVVTWDMMVVEIAQQPVQNPQVANASIIHINDLPASTRESIRFSVTSGTTRLASELTYTEIYQFNGQLKNAHREVQTLAAADYIRTDGELFRVRVGTYTIPLLYKIVMSFNSIGAGAIAYATHTQILSSDDGTSDDGTSDDGTSDDGTSDDGTSNAS